MAHEQCRGLPVQGIIRVWVPEKLREKHLEDVDHIFTAQRDLLLMR
jgi:hypothetical protein